MLFHSHSHTCKCRTGQAPQSTQIIILHPYHPVFVLLSPPPRSDPVRFLRIQYKIYFRGKNVALMTIASIVICLRYDVELNNLIFPLNRDRGRHRGNSHLNTLYSGIKQPILRLFREFNKIQRWKLLSLLFFCCRFVWHVFISEA